MTTQDERALATINELMAYHSLSPRIEFAMALWQAAEEHTKALHPSEAAPSEPAAWLGTDMETGESRVVVHDGITVDSLNPAFEWEPLYAVPWRALLAVAPVLNAGAEIQGDQAKRDGDTAACLPGGAR